MILACISAMPVDAAIKTKNSNRSYAGAYQQINAMRQEQEYLNATAQLATTASATDNLPVMIDDEKLADAIVNNESGAPNISNLESCAMIYPNGVFKWAIPESGIRKSVTPKCAAVVELRDANTNMVLATTTVGAGDSMKCNIDYFPSSGYNMAELSRVELPADAQPTMADVETVMNTEQKQNAGLKIVAAALVGGVGGNLLAPKEAGATNGKIPFGTGKTQLIDTAIGAAAGAGVMAAGTYSGKVAGDTITSTAVNAASGMIVGNMLAGTSGGNGVLATVKCRPNGEEEKDCIIGKFNKEGDPINSDDKYVYIINLNKEVKRCETTDSDQLKNCEYYGNIMHIIIEGEKGLDFRFEDLEIKTVNGFSQNQDTNRKRSIRYKKLSDASGKWNETPDTTNDVFYKIKSANKIKEAENAYAVFGNNTLNKIVGYQRSDWDDTLEPLKPEYYLRNVDGSVSYKIESEDADEGKFEPSTRDADDGSLVDLTNQARIKGTVAGGAVGGALGGIAGYSGAKSEVSERWTSAIREYEDSLSNFVCITGGRYLSKYNDYVQIPEPQKAE